MKMSRGKEWDDTSANSTFFPRGSAVDHRIGGPSLAADINTYKNLMQICVNCKRQLGRTLNMGST